MNLPHQTKGVNRTNRIAEAKMAGVNPAFWSSVLDVLKKAGKGALSGIMG
ncbi:hypothetical protein MSU25_004711 [Salmonella enterica]|nr:hypothetical protein [Salmonella enterica]EHM1640870.1 hypothetical protein [Salmonella enterica subsp. enterica serovar Oranienburg]EHN2637477.1 hypothetical protein [Salmonella enterica]EHO4597225.1 hypothetical protein [Salmonella enterica]EHP2853159.1 hypothetical protein [Salmonella enterica]EHX1052466.1 hypothetical protein [Salmonella enterica subsp. enterica serovar Oranienburg]